VDALTFCRETSTRDAARPASRMLPDLGFLVWSG
jgi:hypothetical protein